MAMIFARAPLRISLGGGGTDLPSYYRERGGFLIAGAIDKYVYLLVHDVFQKRYRLKYSQMEEVETIDEIQHPIIREALREHWSGAPLEIASVADIPTGTGLGSSGSFTVCLLKALATASGRSTTPGWLAEEACRIEIDRLGEPIGKQDQYASAHGGICTYEFHKDDSVTVSPLAISDQTIRALNDQLMLFYTGETRSASAILADQNTRTVAADDAMLANLDRTKALGYRARDLLLAGDLETLASDMHEHWENKRRRSPGMTNERIDALYDLARGNGAIGGKLVGAGGGGFLLLYSTDPEKTRSVLMEMSSQEVRFSFDLHGCYASTSG
jgi:D-glycero-alpha-D-manno-heptose-7-phosphate kinase